MNFWVCICILFSAFPDHFFDDHFHQALSSHRQNVRSHTISIHRYFVPIAHQLQDTPRNNEKQPLVPKWSTLRLSRDNRHFHTELLHALPTVRTPPNSMRQCSTSTADKYASRAKYTVSSESRGRATRTSAHTNACARNCSHIRYGCTVVV